MLAHEINILCAPTGAPYPTKHARKEDKAREVIRGGDETSTKWESLSEEVGGTVVKPRHGPKPRWCPARLSKMQHRHLQKLRKKEKEAKEAKEAYD
jgi:hypothetical protein